jgi:hypothetical protein
MYIMDPFHSLGKKIRQLPCDDGGSVLLLSGMMAFLIAIMALYAVDTSQVIYNRITAQNAADAAAEAAALEQARGLNLIQELNNDHYLFNMTLFGIEMVHLAACVAAPGAVEAMDACCVDPLCWEACPAAIENAENVCNRCQQALPENSYQSTVANYILDVQSDIATALPLLEWAYASQAAQQAGADPVVQVFGDYISSSISKVLPTFGGFSIPSLPGPLASLEPCAFPLNPGSISLNVKQVKGGYWPWIWSFFGPPVGEEDRWVPQFLAAAAWFAAQSHCWEVGDFLSLEGDNPGSWGWEDSYYEGHPGYMTWLAGKTNQTELAGLGPLRWLNPDSSPPAEVSYWMNQSNLPMYTGSSTSSSSLQIPAVIGLASSQVEGTGVIAVDESLLSEIEGIIGNMSSINDFTGVVGALSRAIGNAPVDSAPHLISVYLPNGSAGTSLWIYH